MCRRISSEIRFLSVTTNSSSFVFLCQLTCQSADIMSSLCGVGVRARVRVNNFSSKTTRPRDVLFFLKDTVSIEDEKLFKACKFANLISKLNFYKLIPYPMDNCFTGRRDRSRQTTEKVILYKIPAGPVTECTFARCRLVHTSCLDRMTSRRLFSLSKPIRPLVS